MKILKDSQILVRYVIRDDKGNKVYGDGSVIDTIKLNENDELTKNFKFMVGVETELPFRGSYTIKDKKTKTSATEIPIDENMDGIFNVGEVLNFGNDMERKYGKIISIKKNLMTLDCNEPFRGLVVSFRVEKIKKGDEKNA